MRSSNFYVALFLSGTDPVLAHRLLNLLAVPIWPHSKLPLDDDDCGMLFDDIHRGRSVRPPHAVPERAALVRWDPHAPLALDNCVALEFADAETHLAECLIGKRDPAEVWGEETVEVVRRRREEVRKVVEWVM